MGLVIKTTQPPLLASLIINLQLLFNASKSFHLALVGFDLRDLKSFVVVEHQWFCSGRRFYFEVGEKSFMFL